MTQRKYHHFLSEVCKTVFNIILLVNYFRFINQHQFQLKGAQNFSSSVWTPEVETATMYRLFIWMLPTSWSRIIKRLIAACPGQCHDLERRRTIPSIANAVHSRKGFCPGIFFFTKYFLENILCRSMYFSVFTPFRLSSGCWSLQQYHDWGGFFILQMLWTFGMAFGERFFYSFLYTDLISVTDQNVNLILFDCVCVLCIALTHSSICHTISHFFQQKILALYWREVVCSRICVHIECIRLLSC